MCTPKENHTCNGCMCRVHQKLMNDFRLTNGKPETDCTKFFFFRLLSSKYTHLFTGYYYYCSWVFFTLLFFYYFAFAVLLLSITKQQNLPKIIKKKMCVWLRRLALNFTHLTLYVQIPFCYVFQLAFKYYS